MRGLHIPHGVADDDGPAGVARSLAHRDLEDLRRRLGITDVARAGHAIDSVVGLEGSEQGVQIGFLRRGGQHDLYVPPVDLAQKVRCPFKRPDLRFEGVEVAPPARFHVVARLADQRLHQEAGAHTDVVVDPCRRHVEPGVRQSAAPGDHAKAVGVDERAIDVKENGVQRYGPVGGVVVCTGDPGGAAEAGDGVAAAGALLLQSAIATRSGSLVVSTSTVLSAPSTSA